MTAEAPDLAYGHTWPSLETFTVLAQDRRVVPVVRRLLADGETPLGLYRRLAGGRLGTFLLESAEHGGVWSRYSIIGAASRATLTERDGEAIWLGDPPVGVPTGGNPVEAIRDTVAALATEPIAGLPPLTSGLAGAISYDAVRRWERLPDNTLRDVDVPEVAMVLATDVAVLDHSDGSVLLIANAINYDNTDARVEWAWRDALERLDAMTAALGGPAESTVSTLDPTRAAAALADVTTNMTPNAFEDMVERAKEDIRAGEAFQIVVSQRFDIACPADALDVYRVLRSTNPSPYMYFFRLEHPAGGPLDIVGSSPEVHIKVTGRQVILHPIAGTRPRGKSPEHDLALQEELLDDPKERAEHVMLVDLGRNDLQRVCAAGSVDVVEFMNARHYSHVMHLESTVVGHLTSGHTAYDALAATFPAGTLSGAPKPRAMALIDDYEPTRRGIYGGVVGYADFHGDMDVAIAIRTAVIRGGRAYVQAGAGIVADSVPTLEYDETRNKAAAVLRAIAAASTLRPVDHV
ncbi:MAG: anthranilate synthase component I [Dermatophilaceae bacterium]